LNKFKRSVSILKILQTYGQIDRLHIRQTGRMTGKTDKLDNIKDWLTDMQGSSRQIDRETDWSIDRRRGWQTDKQAKWLKNWQVRRQAIIQVARTETDKTGRRTKTDRPIDRMTVRKASGVTERQTGKIIGRQTGIRTATGKTGRRDCNRKMRADDSLTESQTDQ
jgi:hypothetical protein